MNNTLVVNITNESDTIEVGKLEYGTYVMGVSSHPKSIYQKVDKNKLGEGLNLSHYPAKSSVLLNIKTGALRAVPGSTRVTVYNAELNLTKTSMLSLHVKDKYKCQVM